VTRDEAYATARRLVDADGRQREVYRHVGDYGRRGGDIPATGNYCIVLGGTNKPTCWALIAIVEPEGLSDK
jgi:hypothetical protein